MPNPRNVLIINTPPADTPGKYVIIVGGGASAPTIIFLDKLIVIEKDSGGRFAAYEARVGSRTVARFPSDTRYMMLIRERTELLTPVEAAQFHKTERESVDAVYGDEHKHDHPGLEEIPADVGHPGVYL